MKYLLVLLDDDILLRGTLNEIEDAKEFYKKWSELTDYYTEINKYFSVKNYNGIKKILLKYEEGSINGINFTPHEMRIIYIGLKILDNLIHEPCLLGVVESEYHGINSVEDYWIFDRLEDIKINEDEKYVEINGDKIKFDTIEWI